MTHYTDTPAESWGRPLITAEIIAAEERLEKCKADRYTLKGRLARWVSAWLGFCAVSNRETWAREELADLRHRETLLRIGELVKKIRSLSTDEGKKP